MTKKKEKKDNSNYVWAIGYLIDDNSDKELCSPPLCISSNLDLIKGIAIAIWGMEKLIYCYRYDLKTGQRSIGDNQFDKWCDNA